MRFQRKSNSVLSLKRVVGGASISDAEKRPHAKLATGVDALQGKSDEAPPR